MPRITPEQVGTLHYLINQAANLASEVTDALATFGDVGEEDPEATMTVLVRTTKALQVRDALASILSSITDDLA